MLPTTGYHSSLAPTLIRTLVSERIDLPLYEPFTIATGQINAANNVLIRIELENGTTGIGEGSPSLSSGGETPETIIAAVRDIGTALVGRDATQWRYLAGLLLTNFGAHSCARAAVEMALLDALTRTYNIPFYKYFGGAGYLIETDMTVPIVSADHARELATKITGRGIQKIKVKLSGNLADDEARVVAVHGGAPHAAIMLDGNQGFSPPTALRLISLLERRDILPTLFEQPLHRDDWNGMAALTARSSIPIAADEMVHTPADALRVVQMGAAHVINIKLMKCTFLGALDIIGICRAAHVGLMIGAMMESRLATAAAAHFAAGIGGFDFIDLDTPMLINGEIFHGGYTQSGGTYNLSEVRAGHGVNRW
jgi:L-Ala-D/L-Glu epimerase